MIKEMTIFGHGWKKEENEQQQRGRGRLMIFQYYPNKFSFLLCFSLENPTETNDNLLKETIVPVFTRSKTNKYYIKSDTLREKRFNLI